MPDWNLAGTYLEFCNCEPGCACNFKGFPNSPEGNCQAFVAHRIESGGYDGLELAGAKVTWALWWPGAIHERGGKGHAYVDCESDEQYDALRRIWRGEEGYSFFEIFNSTLDATTSVDRASIELTVDGKSSRIAVEGVGEAVMTPLRNPVSGEENDVRIVSSGFIWKNGQIATNQHFRVDTGDFAFDFSQRHSVFAPFEYSNA